MTVDLAYLLLELVGDVIDAVDFLLVDVGALGGLGGGLAEALHLALDGVHFDGGEDGRTDGR